MEVKKQEHARRFLKVTVAAVFVFAMPFFVSAQETVVIPPALTASSTQKVITLATVNIQQPKIVSESGHSLILSFDISNREGIQTGVKYGVQLLSEIEKRQTITDERIYSEVLTLAEQSNVHKEIVYSAPAGLSGDYKVILISRNNEGLLLAIAFVGMVTLPKESGVSIDSLSCYLQVSEENDNPRYALIQGVDIDPNESLLLTCEVSNSTSDAVILTPAFETHYRSMFGEIVSQTEPASQPISLNGGEKKIVTLTLPKATKAQAYDIQITVGSNSLSSNTIIAHYILRGPSATIQNISLDNNYYRKGATATVTVLWSRAADNFNNSRKFASPSAESIVVMFSDGSGAVCAAELNSKLATEHNIVLPISITRNCVDPHLTVLLKDGQGGTLGERSISLVSPVGSAFDTTSNFIPIIVVLFILVIIAYIGFYWTRHHKGPDGGSASDNSSIQKALLILLAVSAFIPFHSVKADTFDVRGESYVTANLDASSYSPGQAVTVTASAVGPECGNSGSGVTLYARLDGYSGWQYVLSVQASSNPDYSQLTDSGSTTFTAPSSGGIYYVSFADSQSTVFYRISFTVVASCIDTPMSIACSTIVGSYGVCSNCSVGTAYYTQNSCTGTIGNQNISDCHSVSCIATNICGQTSTGTIQSNGICSATPPANPPSYGGSCSSPANACDQTTPGTYDCNGVCNVAPPPNSNCPLPTVSVSISQNPVPYGGNPGFTLTSANASVCYIYVYDGVTADYLTTDGTANTDFTKIYLPTSGTFYHGAFTTPGTINWYRAYCYNSAGVGSGWAPNQYFTVSLAPVNGGWSLWSNCSSTTCGTDGTQTRTCTNPVPSGGGADCVGSPTQNCTNLPCCIPNCSAAASYCSGESFNDANGCGANNCTGTRFCNLNWREVAP